MRRKPSLRAHSLYAQRTSGETSEVAKKNQPWWLRNEEGDGLTFCTVKRREKRELKEDRSGAFANDAARIICHRRCYPLARSNTTPCRYNPRCSSHYASSALLPCLAVLFLAHQSAEEAGEVKSYCEVESYSTKLVNQNLVCMSKLSSNHTRSSSTHHKHLLWVRHLQLQCNSLC